MRAEHPGSNWQTTIRRYGIATLTVTAAGVSRVILLIEYPSDTIAAAAIATVWTLIVHLALTPSRNQPDGPLVF